VISQINNISQFEFMQIRLILLLLFALLLPYIHSYGTTISVSSTASASITNFYQDLAYCSCDLTPSLCDNYCCCDAFCSTVPKILSRPFRPPGLQHRAVCLHPALYKAFVIHHRYLASDPSAICPVCTFQIEEL
jgi:hypothetical protein